MRILQLYHQDRYTGGFLSSLSVRVWRVVPFNPRMTCKRDNRPYPAFQMSSSAAAAAAVLAPSADDEEERMRQRREEQEKAGPLSKVSACYAAPLHRMMVPSHAICSSSGMAGLSMQRKLSLLVTGSLSPL